MPLKFALYPGCAAKGATPELYQSTMAIIGRLGIEVIELAASSCCGAGVIGEADPDVALALNARTFAQAERLGLDIMTICGTCQGVMSAANRRLKNEPGTRERINRILEQDGIAYRGWVQVKHLLWIAVREIGLSRVAETVRSPFRDFRIAFRASEEATSVCFRSSAILTCNSCSSTRTRFSKTSFCRRLYSFVVSRASFVSRTIRSVEDLCGSSPASVQEISACQMPKTQISMNSLPAMDYPLQIAGDGQRRFSSVHYTIRRSGNRLSRQKMKACSMNDRSRLRFCLQKPTRNYTQTIHPP